MPKLAGPVTALQSNPQEVLEECLEVQLIFHDSVAHFLANREPQTLSASIHAPGNERLRTQRGKATQPVKSAKKEGAFNKDIDANRNTVQDDIVHDSAALGSFVDDNVGHGNIANANAIRANLDNGDFPNKGPFTDLEVNNRAAKDVMTKGDVNPTAVVQANLVNDCPANGELTETEKERARTAWRKYAISNITEHWDKDSAANGNMTKDNATPDSMAKGWKERNLPAWNQFFIDNKDAYRGNGDNDRVANKMTQAEWESKIIGWRKIAISNGAKITAHWDFNRAAKRNMTKDNATLDRMAKGWTARNLPALRRFVKAHQPPSAVRMGDDRAANKNTTKGKAPQGSMSKSDMDKYKTRSGSGKTNSGVNPEAKAFVPLSETRQYGSHGLATKEAFMASVKNLMTKNCGPSVEAEEAPKPRDAPARVLLFKNVPSWLTISDALSFVYGGSIDSIFRSDIAEITIQFCEEADCTAYLEAHAQGIRVYDPENPDETVDIEVVKAARGEEVPTALKDKIGSGGSRLIRVDGMLDKEAVPALTALAMEYDVDHILVRNEKVMVGSAYFFFSSLMDGWSFKQQLEASFAWEGYTASFMVDPCKVATGFHEDTVPHRMASATAIF